MKMLLGTNCVGHAIDVLETMVRHAKMRVPLDTVFRLREIAPPGPNLAAQRTTASGQGSGGMRGATGGKADAGREADVEAASLEAKAIAEATGRDWKETWSKPQDKSNEKQPSPLCAPRGVEKHASPKTSSRTGAFEVEVGGARRAKGRWTLVDNGVALGASTRK